MIDIRATTLLWTFGLTKVPLIFWLRPRVEVLDETLCRVRIRLTRRTRNHLGSMYFGALCAGADVAGGLFAYKCIRRSREKIDLVFKSFSAEFVKRAERSVIFECGEAEKVKALVERAVTSSERVEEEIGLNAFCEDGEMARTEVARFTLVLSLKKRAK